MGGKKQYTDEDKAVALATLDANGGNVDKTAKKLGVPRSTLQEWAHNCNINKAVPDLRQHKKKALSEKLDDIAHALADNILIRAESSVLSVFTPLKDAATSLGIVIDKSQLLKGEPTNITQTLTDEEKAKRAAEIINKGRERMRLVK